MAEATGIRVASVALCVRHLRESGLIESGAHGVNARSVTYVEVARLLIALLVTDKPSRASQATQDFGGMQINTACFFEETKNGLCSLWKESGIVNSLSFEDAVATVIRVFSEKHDTPEFEGAKLYDNVPLYLPQVEIGVEPESFCAFVRINKDLIRFDHAYRIDSEISKYPEFKAARGRYESQVKCTRLVDQDVVDDIASVMGPKT